MEIFQQIGPQACRALKKAWLEAARAGLQEKDQRFCAAGAVQKALEAKGVPLPQAQSLADRAVETWATIVKRRGLARALETLRPWLS